MVVLAGQIVNLKMDFDTAHNHVERIQHHLNQADHHVNEARQLIWELHEREGWKALGFASWRACVQEKFERASSTVYRQLSAACVEMEISPNGGIGVYSERVLRPLTKKEFDPQSRRLILDISQQIVGEGGKVTSGTVEAVIDGLKDMLVSGALQTPDGEQHALSEAMSADLIARVREKKIAHKEHIRHMDKKRVYLAGGVKSAISQLNRQPQLMGRVELLQLDDLQFAALWEARRQGKQVYAALWVEEDT